MPQRHAGLDGLRETHDKPCPGPDLTLNFDPSAVQLHNAVHLGQPQPGPFFFCGKKRQENFIEILFGNTFSTILKSHFDNISAAAADLDSPQPRGDGEGASTRHCLEGVRGKIPEHLFQLIVINLHRQGFSRQLGDDRNTFSRPRFMLNQIQRIGKDFVQIMFALNSMRVDGHTAKTRK